MMNSNLRQHVISAGLGALIVVLGQLPLQRKLGVLEHEVAQLRTQVIAQATPTGAFRLARTSAGQPNDGFMHPSADALDAWMRQQRTRAWQTYPAREERASNLLSDEELGQVVAGSEVPLPGSFDGLQQVASAPQAPSDFPQELTAEELDAVVAGAGVPPPGPLATPMKASSAPVQTESVVSRSIRKIEKGGVLLPKGRWQVEPSVSYSHVSRNKVALSGFSVFDVIFIGEIRSDEIQRDILTPAVNVRYGMGNNLQSEVRLPMQFQREESISGPIDDPKLESDSRFGLSDLEAGLFYQFAHETATAPSMIANFKLKMPTGSSALGSGSWGTKAGLIMVKSSDPVALFSNMAYSINFPATINGIDSNPGNSFEYSLGMAYALNYNLALNAGFEQIFIGQSTANDEPVIGSRLTVANLKAGLTWSLSKQLALDFSIGAGLTEDSPDLSLTVSVPYTF
ncbi:MAG: hypothetical protein COV75_02000 [Candidatus Omnitrophica bacterium CG11_big_fil_rev_8_21_14_0_20_63_9]|nr:MAG: hypothetical protein COV75_02000 [Candidatus Omnitrophica bacterium CG11_big_fil_rev_8_21_14_0_20_63_9]